MRTSGSGPAAGPTSCSLPSADDGVQRRVPDLHADARVPEARRDAELAVRVRPRQERRRIEVPGAPRPAARPRARPPPPPPRRPGPPERFDDACSSSSPLPPMRPADVMRRVTRPWRDPPATANLPWRPAAARRPGWLPATGYASAVRTTLTPSTRSMLATADKTASRTLTASRSNSTYWLPSARPISASSHPASYRASMTASPWNVRAGDDQP